MVRVCMWTVRVVLEWELHLSLLFVLFMVVDPQDIRVNGSSGKAANHGEIWSAPLVGRQTGHVYSQ